MPKLKEWFIERKDWFNPMPGYTARLAARDRTKKIPPLPTADEIYRLFAGCLHTDPNLPHNGRHLGVFDYLTFGIFYALESFLRGHWKEPGPAQDKMKKYLIPLWGPLNILRAGAGVSVMAVLMVPLVAVAIPLLILAGLALLGVKLYTVISEALAPWKARRAQRHQEKLVAKEERSYVHSPEQIERDRKKINLREVAHDQPQAFQGQTTAWIITKTVTTVDGNKSVTYDHPLPYSTNPNHHFTKRVYDGTHEELKEIKKRLQEKAAKKTKKPMLEFKEKKPRIGAPNRLVVRLKNEERSTEDNRTTNYCYYPSTHK